MKKGQNTNRPAKGSQIKVQPITKLKDIKAIKKLLAHNPRDFCLFVSGINTNLRASDLTQITVGMVKDKKAGDDLELKEKKTGKPRRITLNKSVISAIQALLLTDEYDDNQKPLFSSQRGHGPLLTPSINRLVKTWCKSINLRGNYGSHTLRKTFGYHQRVQLGTSIPELMVMFNHSTQRQTLDYLCIQAEEIKDAYMRLEL
jgi:integrase